MPGTTNLPESNNVVSITYRFCDFGALLHPTHDFTVGTQSVMWDTSPGVCLYSEDLNAQGRVPVSYSEVNEGPRVADVRWLMTDFMVPCGEGGCEEGVIRTGWNNRWSFDGREIQLNKFRGDLAVRSNQFANPLCPRNPN